MIQACHRCGLQYDMASYNAGTEVRCKCGELMTVKEHRGAMVSCASCGARVPTDATTCPYCKGAVRRNVCPSCFRGLRHDSKFCDHCGAAIRVQMVKPPEATGQECPRCDGKLFHVQLEGYALDQCGSCGGLWVDRKTVDSIMSDAPRTIETGYRPDTKIGSAEGLAQLTGETRSPMAYLPCPACSKLMNRQNYARFSGILIDVCREHGIWYDAGELNQILEFISHGGLVEARKKETERAKEDAQRAKIDARSAQMQANRVGGEAQYGAGMPRSTGGNLLAEAIVEGVFGLFGK